MGERNKGLTAAIPWQGRFGVAAIPWQGRFGDSRHTSGFECKGRGELAVTAICADIDSYIIRRKLGDWGKHHCDAEGAADVQARTQRLSMGFTVPDGSQVEVAIPDAKAGGQLGGHGREKVLYLVCALDIPLSTVERRGRGMGAIAWCPHGEMVVGGGCHMMGDSTVLTTSTPINVCTTDDFALDPNQFSAQCSGWQCAGNEDEVATVKAVCTPAYHAARSRSVQNSLHRAGNAGSRAPTGSTHSANGAHRAGNAHNGAPTGSTRSASRARGAGGARGPG